MNQVNTVFTRVPAPRWRGALVAFVFVSVAAIGACPVDAADSSKLDELPLINTLPEGVDSNNALLRLGYLDVTAAPYHADPTGRRDATAGIQQAVNDARDHQLVTFFPSGVYLISDTIYGMKKWAPRSDCLGFRDTSCVLVGSRKGPRPVLKLAPGASGFDDPDAPKPMVLLWATPHKNTSRVGSEDPRHEQPNINFNQVFQGVDLDLGGHPGAIGIHHAGSQGATLEDVAVNATGAFAGVHNSPGQGGGTYNLDVQGGRYGVYIDKTRFPILVGCRFRDQSVAAVYKKINLPLVMAGCEIRLSQGEAVKFDSPESYGSSLIDTVVTFERPGAHVAFANPHARNLYLQNVWVRGAETIVGGSRPLTADASAWTAVRAYAFCDDDSIELIDGEETRSGMHVVEVHAEGPDAAALHFKHVWDEKTFPSFEDADAFNVRLAGAKGDGLADDTAAIQRAIDTHAKVFLPKGVYRVGETIRLRADTQLFGVGKHHSILMAADGWGKPGTPIIATADDPDATASLSFVGIFYPTSTGHFTALEWRAGRRSIVRDVYVNVTGDERSRTPHYAYHVTGHGGGRWYGTCTDENRLWALSGHEGFRVFLVEGTREPLAVYALNIERCQTSPQMEIRDAEDVRIYYLKTEAGTHGEYGPNEGKDNRSTPLRIRDSRDVSVFACTGVVRLEDDMAMIEVDDSDRVLLTDVRPFVASEEWCTVRERRDGETAEVIATTTLGRMQRN